jgi:hypothetical protein
LRSPVHGQRPNRNNICFSKLGVTICLAPSAGLRMRICSIACALAARLRMRICTVAQASCPMPTSFDKHITRIIARRRKKKMAGITAGWIVAAMADAEVLRNWARGQFPCQAVSQNVLRTFIPDNAISLICPIGTPRPTRACASRGVYLVPKSLRGINSQVIEKAGARAEAPPTTLELFPTLFAKSVDWHCSSKKVAPQPWRLCLGNLRGFGAKMKAPPNAFGYLDEIILAHVRGKVNDGSEVR